MTIGRWATVNSNRENVTDLLKSVFTPRQLMRDVELERIEIDPLVGERRIERFVLGTVRGSLRFALLTVCFWIE